MPSNWSYVTFHPDDAVKRHTVAWIGMAVEVAQTTRCERLEVEFCSSLHLLIAYEHAARCDGDSAVEGLPRSQQRDMTRRLTFVPAGRAYREWHEPRGDLRLLCVYFDPAGMPAQSEALAPRLLFEDAALLDIAQKLGRQVETSGPGGSRYAEALGTVLAHELVRAGAAAPPAKGGLAPWQQRLVTAYIEEHLAEPISLVTLAGLVGLSPCHFCRAFKRSLELSPHRYHSNRRIEHAKRLLAERRPSITDIGLMVGYGETSSFTTAFHKATGVTPTAYRRTFAPAP